MKRDRVEKNTPTKKRVCQKDLETKKSLYRFMWAMTEKDIKKRIKERACLQEVTGGEIPEDMKKGIRNLPDRTRSLGMKLRLI